MRPTAPTPLHRTVITRSKPLWLLAFGVALAACTEGSASSAHPHAGVADALKTLALAPRLSVSTTFRACPEAVPEGGTILLARCPALGPAAASRLSRIAADARGNADEPAALHTLALADLAAEDASGKALERAIDHLRRAAARSDDPAAPLADLAAALLIRAERTQAPRDLLEAYETAEQALRDDARNLAALYNRALALDRFGLVDEAARDWQAYLAADSTSGWADEARRRGRTALATRAPARPAANAPLAEYAAYAAADPQGARELGMDHLLAEWGAAVEAGDAATAGDRLGRAAALGEGLVRRPGGDASLADAVRAIRATAADPAATRTLARAHREYAGGLDSIAALNYADAEPRLAAALAGAGASPALRGWARVYLGTVRALLGRLREGERLLVETTGADAIRHPSLAGRTMWSLGRLRSQLNRWERGLDDTRQSARLFAHAGERENEGAALTLVADMYFTVGEADSGYVGMHRALGGLRPYRSSLRLHNVLAAVADAAGTDGLHPSAVRIMGEGVGVATRTGQPALAAEARLKRARHLAISGDRAGGRTDLLAARPLVPIIPSKPARDWFTVNLREVEAALSVATDPAGASRGLDSAAAYYARIPFPVRVLPAVVGSAEARLAAGDAPGALRRLEDAVGLLNQRRDSLRMEPRRAAVFDAARGVFDRIVLMKLADGRVEEALRYMDQARASLAPTRGRPSVEVDGLVGLPGETAIEYARIADTLLAWTVSAGRVAVARTVLDTVRLARTLSELEGRLQRGAAEAEVRPALSLLYDWLVRPLAAHLGPGAPLVVVADGEIAAVPFAALYDARRGRYLMEDHSLRFAVSLREAGQRPATDAAAGVVLVADPTHEPREHPLLERLRHAREEVRSIAPSYPGAAVLEGAGATRPAVERAFARAGVVHFAGHAVFDDQRPERSYLVLAPGGPSGAGKITAAELARLDLRRVRLVVLSACRTVRSATSRAGGFTGLSGALLAAGAGGAVGSTWEVDDRSTAALMAEFHRAYGARGDGPGALRAAQLALLRSPDATLRNPAAWAGFRYAGR